jgi:Na+/H+-dicarboxylate symporter
MILIPEKKAYPLKEFFDSLNEVILKIIDLIMQFAPFGVFALLATLIVEAPKWDLLRSLLLYSLTLIVGLFTLLAFYVVFVKLVLKQKPRFFLKGILPAQLVAFSTSSSAATLPVTMDRVHNSLNVKKEVSSFVLPVGATINMDGTAVYQAIAAVFIAQTFGIDLSLSAQLGIILTATLASIGAAAVPSAGIIVLVIVLAQAGIPEAGLALIFAVDRPLDMCRTVVNITGDATVSMFVDKIISKNES